MAIAKGRYLLCYKIKLKNKTVMNVSDENKEPIIIEDLEKNNVYLPGTTMAGAFRSYIKNNINEKLANELFGFDNNMSKILIYDSYAELKSYEVRPAVNINSFTGSSKDNGKFERSYIGAGHKFNVNFEIYAEDLEKKQQYKDAIYKILSAIDHGDIMMGSYKSIGAGLFKIEDIQEMETDLNDKKQLFNHLKRMDNFKRLKKENILTSYSLNTVTFELLGNMKTPILVKGYDSLDYNKADGENIINSKGEYFIPGSSIKGVIRNEGAKILKYAKKDKLVDDLFGSSKDSNKKSASKVKFFDAIISDNKISTYNRIKIDKFTGGVRKGALLNEQPLMGKIKLVSKYTFTNEDNVSKSEIALLAIIFKNIAIGQIPFGSGSSIGRGRISGNSLKIKKGNELLYDYDFTNNIEKINKLSEYIKALKEV